MLTDDHPVLQTPQYRCASYVRLSQDDKKKEESNSIVNQKHLIRDYISNHPELLLVQEYADDGFSGATYDRPGFHAMMEDIKKGHINCIIVKDLSRFGRNYIETGKYLEQIFPFLGVRFIAITDRLDTGHTLTNAEQFVLPFKNLINDSYSKDLSIKVRSQLEIKRKKGDFVGSFATYGYHKDPEDHNHLIIDHEAAGVIRKIFDWKLGGYSADRIAEKLNCLGISCPMEYKLKQGLPISTNFRQHLAATWSPGTVLRILHNELYTGVMVQGKRTTPSHKIKQVIHKPSSDWERVDGTHEAIIPKTLFDTVQSLLLRDTRTSPNANAAYLFSGFLNCADCKRNMVRRVRRYKDTEYVYYTCAGYRSKDGCSSHSISEKLLYEAVLAAIQQQCNLILDLERLLQCIQELPEHHVGYQRFEVQLAKLEEQVHRNQEMKLHLTENLQSGVLSKNEYLELGKIYDERIYRDRHAKQAIEAELELLKNHRSDDEWISTFKQNAGIQTLDRPLLAEMVSRIEIHSDKQITVHFRFEDQIQRAIRWLGLFEIDKPQNENGLTSA